MQPTTLRPFDVRDAAMVHGPWHLTLRCQTFAIISAGLFLFAGILWSRVCKCLLHKNFPRAPPSNHGSTTAHSLLRALLGTVAVIVGVHALRRILLGTGTSELKVVTQPFSHG